MKKISLYNSIFFSMIIVSIIMGMSSVNWVLAWLSMELNMISFLGWMSVGGMMKDPTYNVLGLSWGSWGMMNNEPFVKYFLAQSVGSALFLMFPLSWMVLGVGGAPLFFLFTGLFLKAGIAPLHQWFPSVCLELSWGGNMLLMYWQKVIPVFLLMGLQDLYASGVMVIVSVLNLIFGVLGAMGQTQFRSLMAYSSIGHMGWMMGLMSVSETAVLLYFVFYGFIVLPILYSFKVVEVSSFKDMSQGLFSGGFLVLVIGMLSVAGMPPLSGFFVKVYSLYLFTWGGMFIYSVAMCLLAAMSLSYYLNIIINMSLLRVFKEGESSGIFFGGARPVTGGASYMMVVGVVVLSSMLPIFPSWAFFI